MLKYIIKASAGNSLIQRLGHHTFTAGAQIQFLVGELRSYKLCGVARKPKKTKNQVQTAVNGSGVSCLSDNPRPSSGTGVQCGRGLRFCTQEVTLWRLWPLAFPVGASGCHGCSGALAVAEAPSQKGLHLTWKRLTDHALPRPPPPTIPKPGCINIDISHICFKYGKFNY